MAGGSEGRRTVPPGALLLATHAASLARLPIMDGVARREGTIWVPPTHGLRQGLSSMPAQHMIGQRG